VVLNLSATVAEGRYNVVYREYPIKRETEKTIVIIKNNREDRIMRTDLMVAAADYKNDKLSSMQYISMCYTEDLENCISILKMHMESSVAFVDECHQQALEAMKKECLITKFQ
jgi:hypothetical protein